MGSTKLFFFALLVCIVSSSFVVDPLQKLRSSKRLQQQRTPRAAESCPILTCAISTQPCVYSDTSEVICTQNSSCSAYPSGTCQADPTKLTLGETCNVDSDCYSYTCANNKCNQGFYPGTPCKNDNQCAYNAPGETDYVTSCTNKKCAGLKEGETCDYSEQCLPPFACINSTCAKAQPLGAYCTNDDNCIQSLVCDYSTRACVSLLPEGASCDLNNDQCGFDLSCTPTTANGVPAKCIQQYSQKLGSFCDSDEHCGEKMNCDFYGRNSFGISTCINFPTSSSFQACTLGEENSTCPKNETCTCDQNTGLGKCVRDIDDVFFGNPVGIKKIVSDQYNCQLKCARTDTPCIASKCKSAMCKSYNTIYSLAKKQAEELYPKCAQDAALASLLGEVDNGIYGYFECSAAASVSYSLLVVIFVILGLVL